MSVKLLHALRALRLPLRQDAEAAATVLFGNLLQELGVSVDDAPSWVMREQENLKDNAIPTPEMRGVTEKILYSAASDAYGFKVDILKKIAGSYFYSYKKLRDEHDFSHEQAISSLSFSLVIADLSVVGLMSSAQIAKSIRGISKGIPFSRQSVKIILEKLGCNVDFSMSQVEGLIKTDSSYEPQVLADTSFEQAAELVALAAVRLGAYGDIRKALHILTPRMVGVQVESDSTPYLQMLHFQCIISEFCDHAPTDIYEYSPRGERANYLFGIYPQAIAQAGNPFLNNAKSVEVINEGWVRSKKIQDRSKARALYEILASLESLGFAAKRELALWIRIWLIRIIRIASESPYLISRPIDASDVSRVLSSISRGGSSTFGILEQRIVDFCAEGKHPNLPFRGMGDSVNATNRSDNKFGDCEFADINELKIYAYEAHAGHLDEWYIREHLRTLRKSLAVRQDELALLGGGRGWSLLVTFICHSTNTFRSLSVDIDGFQVEIIVKTFSEFLEGCEINLDKFDERVTAHIWSARTPQSVRRKFLEAAMTIDSLVALDIKNSHVRRLEEESAEYVLAYKRATEISS